MKAVDYDWVYMFHSMLSERFGFSDSRRILSLPVADLMFFLDRASQTYLSDRLIVEFESTILGSLESVERGEKLVFRGPENSLISVVPESLYYIVDPDPRFSYVALFPKSGSKSCVLFYPHGSALMSDKHKSVVLDNLLVDDKTPDFIVPFESFEYEWSKREKVVESIAGRVAYILAVVSLKYESFKGKFEVDENAPADYGRSFEISRYVTANIALSHSKHIESKELMTKLNEAFSYVSPFNSVMYSERVGSRRTDLSVLFFVPEAVKRNL
ncbi:MAG: hypothetical protein V1659_03800 [Candidatus Woesearchaeota archaeon]